MILDEERPWSTPRILCSSRPNVSINITTSLFTVPSISPSRFSQGSNPDFVACRKFADYQRYGVPWYWIINPLAESPTIEEQQLVDGRYECRSEIAGEQWFEPGLFPGLVFRLPQLLKGDLKAAVKGKAKKLM